MNDVLYLCNLPRTKIKFWSDIIFMNVGHVILGRPWLFDMDVALWGKSNTCAFNHEGQLIKLISSQPKSKQGEKKSIETRKENDLN